MSGPERPEPAVETTRSLKRKSFSQDDQDDLDKLDRAFKRIRSAVPRVPYILSTPSMHPFLYHSQQEANAWMLGHLFRPHEESLQYRSYMFRDTTHEGCLQMLAGDEDDPEPHRPESRASNSGGQIAKKKLNLSAFKVKHANGTVMPGSKKVSPNLAPTKSVPGQVNGVNKSVETAVPSAKDLRLSTEPRDPHNAAKPSVDPTHSQPQLRTSSPSQKNDLVASKISIDKSGQSDGTPHGLPPLLSPVEEPPTNPHGLPDILSPTLPSNIQAELDRMETQRKRAESNASNSSSDRKSQTLAVPEVRTQKSEEGPRSELRIRSVSVNGKSPNIEAPKPTEASHPRLIVKLKFSKAKRGTVANLLRLPPTRKNVEKKERQDPLNNTPGSSQTRAVEDDTPKKKKPIPKIAARRSDNTTPVSTPLAKPTSTAATATKVPEKRPRSDDDGTLAVPSKRPRAGSSHDRPITPTQQGMSSPALSNRSSAQKGQSQYSTPKNNHKTVNMLRTNSTESNDSTPSRSVATPAGIKIEAKGGPTSAPLTGHNQSDISLLAQTSMKLNQMGRALKHEATKILTAAGNNVTKQDEMRAAVTNLECILSYMAAYFAQDRSVQLRGRASEVEQTWKTLLPLALSYARVTKDFKHLDGLRSYLCSVIASAICTHVAQRVTQAPRHHDSPQDAPPAEHAKAQPNLALLADHVMKMNQHAGDARIALPLEDIQTVYKKTFAARETNAKLARQPELCVGARMSGPYFLPLSNDTTPIQAVRFGLKFLEEYCDREKLVHNFRVNLEKPE